MSTRGRSVKLILFLVIVTLFLEGFAANDAFAARRRGGGKRVRRGGAARVQARKGGRRNRGRKQGRNAGRRNNNNNNNNNSNNHIVNGFDLDQGQVFLNDAGFGGGNVAFIDGNGGVGNGSNNGANNLNGIDPGTLQLVNGSNRIAFVTDRFGRQIPVELRYGAVLNGQLVNPGFNSINQPLMNGLSGNGIFAGSGSQGQFLPGTLQDIKLFNTGQLRTRGESVVIRPGSGGGRRPEAF